MRFNSEWNVGLAVISYPYSWPSIGTNDQQFIIIHWRRPSFLDNVEFLDVLLPLSNQNEIPKSKHVNAERLQDSIMTWIGSKTTHFAKDIQSNINKIQLIIDPNDENDSRNHLLKEAKKRHQKIMSPSYS